MVITESSVANTRLLGPGSKLHPSNIPCMLKKDLITQFMIQSPRVRQNGASERKAPLAGWGRVKSKKYHISVTRMAKGSGVGGRERGGGAEERGGTCPFALVFLPPLPPPFAPVKQAKLWNRKYSYIISIGFLFKF